MQIAQTVPLAPIAQKQVNWHHLEPASIQANDLAVADPVWV